MPQTAGMQPDSATILFTVATVLTLVPVVLSAAYIAPLWRLPNSRYALLLRLACVSIPITIIFEYLSDDVHNFTIIWLVTASKLTSLINILLFSLAETEFLRILSPYVTYLSPLAIHRIQIALTILALTLCIKFWLWYLPPWMQTAIGILEMVLLTTLFIYEVAQQSFLLWFVKRHLKLRPSQGMVVQFTALVCISVVVVVFVMLQKIPGLLPGWVRVVTTKLGVCVEFCGFQAMLLLQRSLVETFGVQQDGQDRQDQAYRQAAQRRVRIRENATDYSTDAMQDVNLDTTLVDIGATGGGIGGEAASYLSAVSFDTGVAQRHVAVQTNEQSSQYPSKNDASQPTFFIN